MAELPQHINPHFRKSNFKSYTLDACKQGIATDRKILSYLISKAESHKEEDIHFILDVLSSRTADPNTRTIAISGSPGVGKSTFLDSFGKYLVDQGKSIAILPVDPTSLLTKGSILGDKTRMSSLVGHQNAFIKPMASALALGGVAPATLIARLLCEQAGFDYIFIETVGVGQSEYEARHLVQCFILLTQPGGGDQLQGIKRGIMELADLLIVTKADGDLETEAHKSLKAYRSALQLFKPNSYGWSTTTASYSSLNSEGASYIMELIDDYYAHMNSKGQIRKQYMDQWEQVMLSRADEILLAKVKQNTRIESALQELLKKRQNVTAHPISALIDFKKNCEDALE